ncbi:hypothetical protein CBL_00889 [Carabus blaptoides fortunei]
MLDASNQCAQAALVRTHIWGTGGRVTMTTIHNDLRHSGGARSPHQIPSLGIIIIYARALETSQHAAHTDVEMSERKNIFSESTDDCVIRPKASQRVTEHQRTYNYTVLYELHLEMLIGRH